MRFTIDTENKVIEVNESVNIADLINELKELLGKRWKEYSLQQTWSYYPYYPVQTVTYRSVGGDEPAIYTDSDTSWVRLTEN